MGLSKKQILNVAKLANLDLNSSQLTDYVEKLEKILEYFKKLDEVNTTDILPTFNPTLQENVFLNNAKNTKQLTPNEATYNSNNIDKGYFVTDGVFKDE